LFDRQSRPGSNVYPASSGSAAGGSPYRRGLRASGALADAGLSKDDVDGFFRGPDASGTGPLSIADGMNLDLRHVDIANPRH
jgi:hypothetical protein